MHTARSNLRWPAEGQNPKPDQVGMGANESFFRRLPLLLLSILPAVVEAQFTFTTNTDNTIAITGYTGVGGAVTLPSAIAGLPVTSIGSDAFAWNATLTSVTIPAGVTRIEAGAFSSCTSLTSVTIPAGVIKIGDEAFELSTNLTGVYFRGNASAHNRSLFSGDNNATVYYLPGTQGWSGTYAGRPTAQWWLPYPLILSNPSVGVQTNAFGFVVSWATNLSVVVEGCTNLASSTWVPFNTNALTTNGWFYFSDPQWTNYPALLYRIRSL